MAKKIKATLASFAVISAFGFVTPETTAGHDVHQPQGHQHTTGSQVRRRATKVRKRVRQQAVSYVCPMHPDMRSHSRGECPKCGMELVRQSRGAKGS